MRCLRLCIFADPLALSRLLFFARGSVRRGGCSFLAFALPPRFPLRARFSPFGRPDLLCLSLQLRLPL